MRSAATALALAASFGVSNAVYQGFNYASTKSDGSAMTSDDFQTAFKAQASLDGTNGAFTSARLYTMLDASNHVDPISALQAASDDKTTSLLLGIWASGGQSGVDAEISALKAAIKKFPDLGSQIVGLSIGSEDLYRYSHIANNTTPSPGVGLSAASLLSIIKQVKGNLTDGWSDVKIGHVDTWTAWTNSDGSFVASDLTEVISSLDWLGIDSYPYFQGTMDNPIEDATDLFDAAFQAVEGVSQGKDLWITETGWPISGPTVNKAVPSKANAQTYWENVGCPNFGKINTWWYTFDDSASSPSFGVVDSLSGGTPNWDLSCDKYTDLPDASEGSTSNSTSSTSSSGVSSTSSGSSSNSNGTTVTTSSPKSTSSSSSSGNSAGSSALSAGSTAQVSLMAMVGGLLALAASL